MLVPSTARKQTQRGVQQRAAGWQAGRLYACLNTHRVESRVGAGVALQVSHQLVVELACRRIKERAGGSKGNNLRSGVLQVSRQLVVEFACRVWDAKRNQDVGGPKGRYSVALGSGKVMLARTTGVWHVGMACAAQRAPPATAQRSPQAPAQPAVHPARARTVQRPDVVVAAREVEALPPGLRRGSGLGVGAREFKS